MMAKNKAEDLSDHVKVIQFSPIADCFRDFEPGRTLAVAEGIFAVAARRIKSNGIAVIPDERLEQHARTYAEIEALDDELLAVTRAEEELYG